MRGGSLHERIEIQQATEAADGAGQLIRTWSAYKRNVPAMAEQVSGGETLRGRHVSAEATTVFTTRWIDGVTTRMRVVWGGVNYLLVATGEVYTGLGQMRIQCKEAD